jgi:hypothetical protein
LVFSDHVVNGGPVPEPTTALQCAAALLTLATYRRVRRPGSRPL